MDVSAFGSRGFLTPFNLSCRSWFDVFFSFSLTINYISGEVLCNAQAIT
jgi:hypothetical protein